MSTCFLLLAVLRRRDFAHMRRGAVQLRCAGVRAKSGSSGSNDLEGAAELVGGQAVRKLDRLKVLLLRVFRAVRRLRS